MPKCILLIKDSLIISDLQKVRIIDRLGIIISEELGPNTSLNLRTLLMKRIFEKNETKSATKFKMQRAFAMEDVNKDNPSHDLLYQRVGKSRQEIFDLMKILKTF